MQGRSCITIESIVDRGFNRERALCVMKTVVAATDTKSEQAIPKEFQSTTKMPVLNLNASTASKYQVHYGRLRAFK